MSDKQTHWQSIYRRRAPTDVSWHQQKPELSLAFIERSGVRRDAAIIDVGGGASTLVDFLHRAGFTDLSVLDISASALDCAKQRLGDAAGRIEWLTADVTKFSPPRQFSLWHDRAVFHFLTDARDRQRYIHVLKQALKPGGHLVMATFALNGPQKCSGLQVMRYDAPALVSELGDAFELVEEADEAHITPTGEEQHFVYCRFVKQEQTNG